jgi:hypothetical protein
MGTPPKEGKLYEFPPLEACQKDGVVIMYFNDKISS